MKCTNELLYMQFLVKQLYTWTMKYMCTLWQTRNYWNLQIEWQLPMYTWATMISSTATVVPTALTASSTTATYLEVIMLLIRWTRVTFTKPYFLTWMLTWHNKREANPFYIYIDGYLLFWCTCGHPNIVSMWIIKHVYMLLLFDSINVT